MSRPKTLAVPEIPSVRYERNFIDVAVCELRFPTLLELETKPPTKLHSKIRKEYPTYEVQEYLDKNRAESVPGRFRYVFKSRKHDWSVTVHSEGISLETRHYTEFGDFLSRLTSLLGHAAPVIDTNFFTRVGIRYINKLPVDRGELCDWLNEQLCSPLTSGPYGSISKYVSEVRGHTETGQYTFRHAVIPTNGRIDAAILDFDYWKEDVESGDVIDLIKAFNKENFSFFYWCLGEKAREMLGKGHPKAN